MRLIIDIPDTVYEAYKEWHRQGVSNVEQSLIALAMPYEERPKGEWTDLLTDGRHIGWIACSVCGQEPPNESNLRTKFCPNCGAKMKGDTE